MFSSWTSKSRWDKTLAPALVAAGLLLAAGAIRAGGPPWGVPSGWPWDRLKTHGYDEKPPATPPPANVTRPPVRYTLAITVLPQKAEVPKEKMDVAAVMAYLPEDALLWIGDYQTKQRGTLREFESPSLKRGAKYTYGVRLVWFEDGHWVSETKELPVSAGEMTCLFLTKPSAIAAALAELPPEDRKMAEQQRFCAVQPENPLGAMGKPTKLTIRGQPVFLCCPDCAEKARENPDKTLAVLKELKRKGARTPPK
jgi:uncharacterized protein (TIGR03000 family)